MTDETGVGADDVGSAVGARLRRMRDADVEPVHAMYQRDFPGDFRQHLRFVLAQPVCHALVAEADCDGEGVIIGTAVGTQKGAVGWLGYVVVAPEHRRRGVGAWLSRACTEALARLGCTSVVLTATDMGRGVYERLGFREEGRAVMLRGPTLPAVPTDPRLRPVGRADLDQVCALDRHATGEDRSALLRSLIETTPRGHLEHDPAGRVVASPEAPEVVRGYYLPTPWGQGPAVAPAPEDGVLLLGVRRGLVGHRQGQAEVSFPLFEENEAGRSHLEATGFRAAGTFPRMVWGTRVEWHPRAIWGLFSGGLG